MSDTAEDDPFVFLPKGVRIIHARIEPDDIVRVFPTSLSVVGDVGQTLRDLGDAIKSMLTKERIEAIRQPRIEAAKKFTASLRESWRKAAQATWNSSPMPWERVVFELDRAMDQDAVVVQEIADNKRTERWIGYGEEGGRTLVGRTTGQCLGWGVGAALGVKLAWPDRQVVSLQGDGGIMFGQTEAFWTYARTSTPLITVVMNNRSYDGVRRRQFRGRTGGRKRRLAGSGRFRRTGADYVVEHAPHHSKGGRIARRRRDDSGFTLRRWGEIFTEMRKEVCKNGYPAVTFVEVSHLPRAAKLDGDSAHRRDSVAGR